MTKRRAIKTIMQIDDKITLKKIHPCGGKEWKITRIGADIKLQCLTCGKYVNLTRDELKKRAASEVGEKE